MFFFYIIKQRTYKFKMIAQQYLSEGLKNQTSSLVLMLIIGVLIYSLNQTNFAVNVVEGINTLESYVSWLNPLYLLPFIVIILGMLGLGDRKSTRLNSSHVAISYAVFCLNTKN